MRILLAFINADTLAAVIKDVVLRMNLDLHNCRGLCYDGAANMARSRTGTATQLHHVEERAIFTHCYDHALNLAVADVVKQSKVIRDVLDTVGEINKLLKYSPRHDSLFVHQYLLALLDSGHSVLLNGL